MRCVYHIFDPLLLQTPQFMAASYCRHEIHPLLAVGSGRINLMQSLQPIQCNLVLCIFYRRRQFSSLFSFSPCGDFSSFVFLCRVSSLRVVRQVYYTCCIYLSSTEWRLVDIIELVKSLCLTVMGGGRVLLTTKWNTCVCEFLYIVSSYYFLCEKKVCVFLYVDSGI